MKPRWFRPWWLLLLIPLALGLARLRFNVEVLDLLPGDIPSVAGLKLYQQKFSNSRELIITLSAPDRELATQAAAAIAERLRANTNLVTEVTWQPPWLEHPEQTAELIAHLWFNQPPQEFSALAARLVETNLPAVLAATREELATTLSPTEIARLIYDPFGLTRLPDSVAGAAPGFDQGDAIFSSPDGKFRILFVKSRNELAGYRECSEWLTAVKAMASSATSGHISLGFTGRPAFVAEISASMQRDITISVFGTAVIIAILFWLAHRRWKPMLWLLTLLALILGGTLALGGLLFGTINVVSMGFAAILLGLAVDYAVVHYQEALAHPDLTVPQIRRAIAPSIFWAALTTIVAFGVLNFGGLPGLAQLGSLVAVGVALSACVMIFAFLPPLFPDRMRPQPKLESKSSDPSPVEPVNPLRAKIVFASTGALFLLCGAILLNGWPKMDATANVVQPRNSQAYSALEAIKEHLNQKREPLWLVIAGRNESEVARRLGAVDSVLNNAVSNHVLAGFTIPTALWPRPEFQDANRAAARRLVAGREAMRAAALAGGFSEEALRLSQGLLDTWQRAGASPKVFWPTNQLCTWILDKLVAREPTGLFAVAFLFPPTNSIDFASLKKLEAQLPQEGVWLSGWELLGGTVFGVVKQNMWKLVLPMISLVLLSLWFAFRRFTEILLSLGILFISGLCLLSVMKVMGWSWNLLNLMAMPLILGTGVDYSLFMQLALRRHRGDLCVTHRSVGRALLLCGATAVSGFGSLGFSSNAGMASLGQVCAVGIGCNMLISIYLLPVWWRSLIPASTAEGPCYGNGTPKPTVDTQSITVAKPSATYRATVWRFGLVAVRLLPERVCRWVGIVAANFYRWLCPRRCEVVAENLMPVLDGDLVLAERTTRALFQQFALKIVDLWRYESGVDILGRKAEWHGRETFTAAQARGKGVLIVTPHLGNWEFGASFFIRHGIPILVLTQPEPDARLTELRQASRARHGIETLVVGEDPFAFVEVIKRLNAGVTVALLIDRPPAATAVAVELFGRPFQASIAAAELARASGCAVVPAFVVRKSGGYHAQMLPELAYDRTAIGDRAGRIRLTQEILRALEPAIRQHVDQWYHFVPVWPTEEKLQVSTPCYCGKPA